MANGLGLGGVETVGVANGLGLGVGVPKAGVEDGVPKAGVELAGVPNIFRGK